MNPSFHTAVLVGMALALVAVLSAIAWLVLRRRAPKPPSPVEPPPASAARAAPRAYPPPSAFDKADEWESFAPYPGYLAAALHDPDSEPDDAPRPSGTRETSAVTANAADARAGLHGALESLMDSTAPEEPAKPATTVPAETLMRCPRCLSSRIDTRNRARKAGSTIGSVAGATGAMAAALSGAETGAVVGSIAGPLGTVFGGLAGAVIAGLFGSAAGCAAGSAVGAAIDDNVLDNHVCLACGHGFSTRQR